MKNSNKKTNNTEDISPAKVKKFIKFLNKVAKPEEIAAILDISGNREASLRAARKVINHRDKNGNFKSLAEVGNTPRLGRDRFARLVASLSDITPVTNQETTRYYGVYPVLVVANNDPEGQGRIKVRLPWGQSRWENNLDVWARLATMSAGNSRGSWFLPDLDDEVLVAFEGGDMRMPYVVGALWNEHDPPPESMHSGNNKKVICSRNGLKIVMDDKDGTETLRLETPGGQKLALRDGPGTITIADSNGNKIELRSNGITVDASAKVTVNASSIELGAAMLTVNAGMSKFSGVIKADTVITNSVISSSYTPGAGNIW